MKDRRDRESEKLEARDISFKDAKKADGKKPEEADVRIEIKPQSPILSKLSNFWYYHKWKVIIISFFVVVFAVGIFQMVTKVDGDESIIISGPQYFDNEEMMEVEKILTSLKPRNPDGSAKKIDLYTYSVYSEEEMDEANHQETNDEGQYIQQVLPSYNVEKKKEFKNDVKLGRSTILIISESLYLEYREIDWILPLGEVFGDELPEGVLDDGYGVRLGETDLYAAYEGLQVLDGDLVVCMIRSLAMGANNDKSKYAESVELYKRIVTFEYEGAVESESSSDTEKESVTE